MKYNMNTTEKLLQELNLTRLDILNDYKIGNISREASILARKEVLTGKAKFGIFGDGKELPQLALAHQFKKGDWRSGYYRDQTLMMATGMSTVDEFFSQLYGDTDINRNPSNAGRSFNNHWGTRLMENDGSWKEQTQIKNTAADLSPTAGQMPKLVGLAYASKLYRENKALNHLTQFSITGNEVAFGTIGDASTSEGHFFESMNAAGVLQIPLAMSVWDDGYGISVAKKYQTTKESISELLAGFEPTENKKGIKILKARGWNYPELLNTYATGIKLCRNKHQPVLFHIEDITQPQGHSTSGSHERYKSKERLAWEAEFDGLKQMRLWMETVKLATSEELNAIEKEAKEVVKKAKSEAWKAFTQPIKEEKQRLLQIIEKKTCTCKRQGIDKVTILANELRNINFPIRKDNFSTAKKILRNVCLDCSIRKDLQSELSSWLKRNYNENQERYSTFLNNDYPNKGAISIKAVAPTFSNSSPMVNGREILRDNFDVLFSKEPRLVTFGEDTGKIGGVNQSLEGMQEKYGELRITDTGIRETTIIGQGIGLALRGLRPIAEIQYFDYLLYGLQTLSDDLASLAWRTKGGQIAPLIVRTRGHRLEGIWHSGSPLSMVINSIRGMYVCVPRNMTQAAGFYNTLLDGEDPALVIEPLNGYRLKEKRPDNLGEFRIPLGKPEILNEGEHITLVTYGSCVRIAQDAVKQLESFNIRVELIDVQTLLPFDTNEMIKQSIKKTGRIVFFDEDVPGGATAFMMKKVLEDQKAYFYLDSEPRTITAKEHRPAYGTDGDYISNPNAEDVFEVIYETMHESDPNKYPKLY
jgi:pyruvate/2-oxoglutarate/acetoin dehydrogenase E1 component/TPP-dependent pyruvate/acetoin dehydrogenase alpha subunit